MIAPLPENEAQRLEALQQTGLLDSSPEEDFDALARLASVICGTPIATITLIDRSRQWFKANIGQQNSETSRDIAFCSHTILQSDLFVVEDALEDPRFAENPLVLADPSIRFYAGMPLHTDDGLRLGTLCVIDRTPRGLSSEQRQALHLLAEQANRQINLRRQRRILEARIADTSLVEKELRASQALFHAFMDNSPFVGFMKDSEGRMVYYNQRCAERFQIGRDTWLGKSDAELWPKEHASSLRSNDLAVLRKWSTMIVEEKADHPQNGTVYWRSYKFPFRDSEGREYVATLAVDITSDKETERQIRSYQRALEAANEKLLAMAVTDSLTGLANRRAFESTLEREYAIARRYGQPLSLLMLDIDNFKAFNDRFGHDQGDRVLTCVADVIRKSFRSSDFCTRYGGEEFAVILPNTPKQSAAESAERVRATVAGSDLDGHRVTISIGLATLESANWSKAEVFRHADEALYNAKGNGKNQVAVYGKTPA
jgi:diguanylate cyclase (GGDEF)-like protein/PAS domain S-box-containing protein